eukprot:NODE_713_length_653_cov_261.950570_g704_i0.p2 GENE.NODE_713_length_653_cov_261.950570_g704_i0~~NODE_713_length_653_cov_261.950570_g704_i0.p2  ORF type:complete len:80 (-),score=32.01 NODE_713_length_653_cov_261.950570_g704_i0:1-240(-)
MQLCHLYIWLDRKTLEKEENLKKALGSEKTVLPLPSSCPGATRHPILIEQNKLLQENRRSKPLPSAKKKKKKKKKKNLR